MSLIRCIKCNKRVSNEAASCPNCGQPIVQNHSIKFDQAVLMVCAIAFVFMFISRAPKTLNGFSLSWITLNINAGYVICFSFFLLSLLLWFLWIIRDNTVQNKHPYASNRRILPTLVIFPALASLFMLVQYVKLFAPKKECNTFNRVRFFWDTSLYGMQPEYCMTLPDAMQASMPWIYPPLQTWINVLLVIVSCCLSAKLYRYLR